MELRDLPKVDALANHPSRLQTPEPVRMEAARRVIDSARKRLLAGESLLRPALDTEFERTVDALMQMNPRQVINASGVILHTGLGRARLAPSVHNAMESVLHSHSALEINLETGERGDRQLHVKELLCRLTGAEDAFVVNNCAAAVVLTLSALCADKEVILSRGEMVEIGGAFRMPDIIKQSGAKLVEVGCTNKTRLSDYREAIADQTAAILRCHPSNFKVVGFTESVPTSELATLGVPVIDDAGSGCLVDLRPFGLPRTPLLGESLRHGAAVTMASGDKLLGGPQAGIILGSPELIAKIKRHPLARAFRIDKLSLAALEATLRLYWEGREASIPTLEAMGRPLEHVKQMAERIAGARPDGIVRPGSTEVGGGSAPGEGIPTYRAGFPDASLVHRLRGGNPPIIAYVEDGHTWLDPRTMDEMEVELACQALR
jgi:L-seryl-tRNA(Ser) seleniumtransferase